MGKQRKKKTKRKGGSGEPVNSQNLSAPPDDQTPSGDILAASSPPFPSESPDENFSISDGVLVNKGTMELKQDHNDSKKYTLTFRYDAFVPGRYSLSLDNTIKYCI